MRRGAWLCMAAALVLPAAAQAMSVAAFLAKAKALQAQGMLALASPDLPLVRDAAKTASSDYRAQIEVDRKADRPPRACPPPVGQTGIDAKTLVAAFEAIPPAQRGVSVKSAFYALMDRRFPCR